MNRDQNLITLTMNSNGIVKVFKFVVRRELNIDVLRDSAGDHTFFVVLNLKIWSLWWKNMEALRCWRVINDFYLQNMGFSQFETGKLHHGW